jgi:hypothetical protein
MFLRAVTGRITRWRRVSNPGAKLWEIREGQNQVVHEQIEAVFVQHLYYRRALWNPEKPAYAIGTTDPRSSLQQYDECGDAGRVRHQRVRY